MYFNFLVKNQPRILMIDSGIGGLSLYRYIERLFPNALYTYLIDNEVFPYGNKHDSFIVQRIIKLIYSVERKQKIDMIILACNTASVTSLKIIKKIFSYPIIGTIPNIKAAEKFTQNNLIGLLATNTTINSKYINKIKKNINQKNKILTLNVSKLVEIAENKFHGLNISILEIRNFFNPWLKKEKIPDVIILGCTHLKFLINEFKLIFPKGTLFIDSYENTAKKVISVMKKIKKSKEKKILINKLYYSMCTLKVLNLSVILKDFNFLCLENLKI